MDYLAQPTRHTHVINLIVKSIIKQFDLPKAQVDGILDEATKELFTLAGDLALRKSNRVMIMMMMMRKMITRRVGSMSKH